MERTFGNDEPVWADRLLTLLAWRRFVLFGLAVSWLALAALFALRPVAWNGEATLALPNTNDTASTQPANTDSSTRLKSVLKAAKAMDVPFNMHLETSPRSSSDFSWAKAPGFPVASYKKLEKSLRDEGLFTRTLSGKLSLAEVGALSPVTSAGRNDVQRLDKADAITSIALGLSSPTANGAVEKVTLLGELVRKVVLMNVARDELQRLELRAAEQALDSKKERIDLEYTNRSLARAITDLEALGRTTGALPAGGREIGTAAGAGHRYLPPAVQVLGLRAAIAENEHLIRLHDHAVRAADLTIEIARRTEARMDREFAAVGVAFDPSVLLREEWTLFGKEKGAETVELPEVATDVEGLVDALEAYRGSMYFVQKPGAFRGSRGRLPYLAAGAALAFFVLLIPITVETLKARQKAVHPAAA